MKKNVKGKAKVEPDPNPIEHYDYIQEGNLHILLLLKYIKFML